MCFGKCILPNALSAVDLSIICKDSSYSFGWFVYTANKAFYLLFFNKIIKSMKIELVIKLT